MEVVLRTNSEVDPAPFLGLLARLYGIHKSVLTSKTEEYIITINPENPAGQFVVATHIAVMVNGRLSAHATAFSDSRMQGVMFVGHIECDGDDGVSSALFAAIDTVARRARAQTIIGPVDGNLWRTFRAPISGNDAPFFSEPYSRPEVSASFVANGYTLVQQSKTTRARIPAGASSETPADIICARVPATEFPRVLPSIHSIIGRTFVDTPYFFTITLPEFAFLFSAHKGGVARTYLSVATHGDNVVGFLLAYRSPEAEPAGVVAKTMAILPEFRHKGIGRALFALLYNDALAEGFENVYYSTMRTDNTDIQLLTSGDHASSREVRTYGVFMKTV